MPDTQMLRIAVDALDELRALAALHGRSMGEEAATIIHAAFSTTVSRPNADVTISDARTMQAIANGAPAI